MKRRLVAFLLLLCIAGISPQAAAQFYVSDGEGDCGESVNISISVEDNKGFAALTMDIGYAVDKLYVKDAACNVGGQFEYNPYYGSGHNVLRIVFVSAANIVDDGELFDIEFGVIKNQAGGYVVELEPEIVLLANDLFEDITDDAASGSIRININEDYAASDEEETAHKGGSTSSGSNKNEDATVNLPTEESEKPTEKAQVKFNDIANYAWAAEAINALASSGVINGTAEGEFSPQTNIKRGDFVLMLMRVLGIDENAENVFSDIEKDYYKSAIATAYEKGYVTGVGENKFLPENNISRQDMFTIVYRILNKAAVLDEKSSDLSEFLDRGDIAAYAFDAVAVLYANDLVHGSDSRIRALDSASRAETAVFIHNVYDLLKKIKEGMGG